MSIKSKNIVIFSYESKNRYYSHSGVIETKFRQMIRLFTMDSTTSDRAKLTNISVSSIGFVTHALKNKVAQI